MSVREEFDAWAAEGRDRGMEERHWHTAKHVLARMPVESDDTVLDLGAGSGYALRALRDPEPFDAHMGWMARRSCCGTPARIPTILKSSISTVTSTHCHSPTVPWITASRGGTPRPQSWVDDAVLQSLGP
jgi:hypothetical protein